jgi:raffinose/stachyose/melibiose transport system permease protein
LAHCKAKKTAKHSNVLSAVKPNSCEFLTEQELFTVVTSYFNFTSRFSRDWGLTSAAAMMMIVPILVIFLALQRRFIDGLTQGGLKG